MKKILYIASLLLITWACSNDADDETFNPVTVADYITPVNNAVCEGTATVNEGEIEVLFSWEAFAENPLGITYTINLTNLTTNATQVITIENGETNATIVLEPNTAYEWTVTATNDSGESVTGATGQFHTPYEATTNYAPFPANLLLPSSGDTVPAGDVAFSWEGNDPDTGETANLVYDLYVSTTNPPTISNTNITVTN